MVEFYFKQGLKIKVFFLLYWIRQQMANKISTYVEAAFAGANFSGGSLIEHILYQGGKGPQAVGGTSRGSQEWLLARNTVYVLIMQNIGANANYHMIGLDWYEHEAKH